MKTNCLIISLLWVILGTFVHLSMFPDYNYLGFDYDSFLYSFLWWITFPFNYILVLLLYSTKLDDIYIVVIFLQIVKVLVYWWMLYKIYLFFKKVKNKEK